jgi:hypothetical protein
MKELRMKSALAAVVVVISASCATTGPEAPPSPQDASAPAPRGFVVTPALPWPWVYSGVSWSYAPFAFGYAPYGWGPYAYAPYTTVVYGAPDDVDYRDRRVRHQRDVSAERPERRARAENEIPARARPAIRPLGRPAHRR